MRRSQPNTPTNAKKAGKERFPTSQEVLQRLRWDPDLRIDDFVVAYEERFQGRRDMRANEFPMGGEIPWHRVWQIRLGRMVIWDRERREHRLAQLRQLQQQHSERHPPKPQKVEKNNAKRTPLAAHPTYRYEEENWQQVEAMTAETPPGTMRICSYNVLFDLYDREKIHTSLRRPALHRLLDDTNADIIGLQEITDDGLRDLLSCPWVQRQYHSSAIPGSDTIQPYGQVLLSRIPIQQSITLSHSPHKRSLLVVLATHPTPLGIAVVHLTSDRRKDARNRRKQQLADIVALIDGTYTSEIATKTDTSAWELPRDIPWLLLGDFNTRDEALQDDVESYGFIDVWPWLHPGQKDAGDTFVPAQNPLAALSSQSQRSGRLDRILLRDNVVPHTAYSAHPQVMLTPTHISLLGCDAIAQVEPLGALHPSDHYGILSSLQYQTQSTA